MVFRLSQLVTRNISLSLTKINSHLCPQQSNKILDKLSRAKLTLQVYDCYCQNNPETSSFKPHGNPSHSMEEWGSELLCIEVISLVSMFPRCNSVYLAIFSWSLELLAPCPKCGVSGRANGTGECEGTTLIERENYNTVHTPHHRAV